jgi:molecular chaperone DnaK (HSP70)
MNPNGSPTSGRDGQGMNFGQAPVVGGGSGDRRPGGMNGEDVRQFRGEITRWTREAEQLRKMLQGEKIDPKEIDAMLRNLRQLADDRVYKDANELARLQAQVTDSAKRLEYDLRRKVEGAEGQLLLSGSDEVPEKFRKSVEQYYRSLSKAPDAAKAQEGSTPPIKKP